MRRCLALMLLAGCGDGVVDQTYRGDPLFRIEGQILSVDRLPPEALDAPIRAAVFWNTETTIGARVVLFEQASVSTEVRFPSTFVMTFFQPPEARHLVPTTPAHGRGLILVYADRDRDGRYEPGADILLGGTSDDSGLLYAPTNIPATASPTQGALARGFHLVELEGLCSPEREDEGAESEREGGGPSTGPACDAGRPCAAGLVCDDGICATEEPVELVIAPNFNLDEQDCD